MLGIIQPSNIHENEKRYKSHINILFCCHFAYKPMICLLKGLKISRVLNLLLISYTIYFKVSCLPKCRQCVLCYNINFMSLLINVSNVSWTYTHRFERWLLLGLLIPQKAINYKTNISAFFLLSYTFFVVVVIFHYLSPGSHKRITKFCLMSVISLFFLGYECLKFWDVCFDGSKK